MARDSSLPERGVLTADEERWQVAVRRTRVTYSPGSAEPSTELLLSHKHPDDRAQVAAAIT
nr:hypothetical protein [Nocardia jejuensis]